MEEIKIGDKVFIRNIGKDEYWLQDVIYNNPDKLGLGDLVPLHKERKQISGGRLDILLKDPNDDSMYEVEVMLGETDPSHIIRAIEYWDNEKRKYPQRQHYCVLIAESFDRRYFNVIQILNQNIPMIAIQADLIQVEGELILHFSKILDVYVEPEDEAQELVASENTWQDKAKWTLKAAKILFSIISKKSKNLNLNFTQSYISIMINGRNAYLLDKRTEPNSILWFNVKDEERQQAISKLLKAIEKYTKNPLKEKDKFINWILFNLIIGNSDAHGKNISFYVDKDGISITPFYDILNTSLYKEHFNTKLALSIGDNYDLENITYEDLVDLAYDLKVKESFLMKRLKSLIQKVKTELNKLPDENIDKKLIDKLNKLNTCVWAEYAVL